jgi:hypothetical protein
VTETESWSNLSINHMIRYYIFYSVESALVNNLRNNEQQ